MYREYTGENPRLVKLGAEPGIHFTLESADLKKSIKVSVSGLCADSTINRMTSMIGVRSTLIC
jgi:hypothetical protein